VTWYLTRSLGLVLLVAFTAVTALGVVSRTARAGGRVPRFVSTDLHRRLSLLAMALLVGHVAVSVADSYVSISWLDAVVPFVGSYRPLWLGLGTLAGDLMVAVTVTSLLRGRLSPAVWRGVHLAAYAAWPGVVLHSLGTGSDTRRLPVLALTGACVLVVLAAVAWRLRAWPAPLTSSRLAGLAALPVIVVLVAVWTWGGPLAPGWAKKSGTPHAPASISRAGAGQGGSR
jgi:methionine sulfoxide reductase heme-binding subunit